MLSAIGEETDAHRPVLPGYYRETPMDGVQNPREP
jgi:hypothetical protein